MAFLEAFGGGYDQAIADIHERRRNLGQLVEDLTPVNIDEIIEHPDEDDDPKFKLEWAKIKNPRSSEANPVYMEVLPVFLLGWVEDGSGFSSMVGATDLDLFTKLPSGEEKRFASMALQGNYLFLYPHETNTSVNIRWDSADADLILSVTESALTAQLPK